MNRRKKIGDSLESKVKDILNNMGMNLKIARSKKNGQIDLQGFNYRTGKDVYVECKSRQKGKIDNQAVAVFVNKLFKRDLIIGNSLRADSEAYIITDSYFTKDAEDDAKLYGIELIDKTKLGQIETLSRLDERYSGIKCLSNICNYVQESGVRNIIASWLRRKIFNSYSGH